MRRSEKVGNVKLLGKGDTGGMMKNNLFGMQSYVIVAGIDE